MLIESILVFGYLIAVIAANLLIAKFGPSVAIVNAFVFIGLDLTTRDFLHEKWKQNLWAKMLILIFAGSAISWFLNRDASNIAIASFVAFAAAGLADSFTYWVLSGKTRFLKINGSNVISAGVDSTVFLLLAFGFPILWTILVGQFFAKVAGGFFWSLGLRKINM